MSDKNLRLANETASLTVYMARTFQNIVPSLMEMIAEIIEHIDDEDLTTIIRGKLMALEVVQDQIKEGEKNQ